jgi:signal transduction histidine kinase
MHKEDLSKYDKHQLVEEVNALRTKVDELQQASQIETTKIEQLNHTIRRLKEEQQQLQVEKKLLKKIKQLAKLGSWQWNIDTDQFTLSDSLYEMYGLEGAQRSIHSFLDHLNLMHHSDKKRVRSVLLKAVSSSSRSVFSFKTRIIKPDGTLRSFSCKGRIGKSSDNELVMTVACMDATDSLLKEKALQESEEKFRLLAEESPARIFKINKKLHIEYINKLALSEAPALSTASNTIHPFFNKSSLPLVIDAIYEVFEETTSRHIEYQDVEKDQEKWHSLAITPLVENGNVVSALLLSYDISEKKRHEQSLKDLNEELERKVRKRTQALEKAKTELEVAYKKEKELGNLKSQFVSTASHQFRTPLTVIQSNVGLLEMLIQSSQPGFQQQFDRINGRIQAEIRRMTDLMDNVLILGKKEAGTLKVDLQTIDLLKEVISITEKYNQIQQDGRSITVSVKGKAQQLQLDLELFENAFSNLISNAFKYSKDRPAPKVLLDFGQKETQIVVQDYGLGIPEEDLEHIFEPFYRANNVNSITGTGLGTAIAKTYFELMGVKIKVKSKLNEGTCFTILIKHST